MRTATPCQSSTACSGQDPDSRQVAPKPSPIRSALALGLLSAIVVLPLSGGTPANALPKPVHSRGLETTPPVATWVDNVIEDLEDIYHILEMAQTSVDDQLGPLTDPDLSDVADNLDDALSRIEKILDENQFPSLNPPSAGSIDTSIDPSTLPDYAKDCADLAADAVDEAKSTLASANGIGSHLKTIRHLITRASPHSYRTKAGIE